MPTPLNCKERPLGQRRTRGRREEEEEPGERYLIAAENEGDCSEKEQHTSEAEEKERRLTPPGTENRLRMITK